MSRPTNQRLLPDPRPVRRAEDWPILIRLGRGLEPTVMHLCARGLCRAVLHEITMRDAETGWLTCVGQLDALIAKHAPDCRGA